MSRQSRLESPSCILWERESDLEGTHPNISAHGENFAFFYATDRGAFRSPPCVSEAAATPFGCISYDLAETVRSERPNGHKRRQAHLNYSLFILHYSLFTERSVTARMGITSCVSRTPQLCIMHYALCIEKALCIHYHLSTNRIAVIRKEHCYVRRNKHFWQRDEQKGLPQG